MTAQSGKAALDNADNYHTYSPGYCLKYVRGPCWEIGSLYGSAIDAWHGAHKRHPGDRNPPTGAPCFYKGGNYGHAVIYRYHDNGKIRSTDCQTTGNVNNDSISWPERAWGYEYLGWTEDLNGVDLPLGGGEDDDDMPLSDQDINKIANAVWDHLNPIYDEDVPEGTKKPARVVLGQTHNRAGDAREWAKKAAQDNK